MLSLKYFFTRILQFFQKQYKPPHDKTSKMTVRPEKTQISLGIRPVWSVFDVCLKLGSLATH